MKVLLLVLLFSMANSGFCQRLTATVKDVLACGNTLNGANYEQIISQDGRTKLLMQADGNLVIYYGRNPIWASNTNVGTNLPNKAVLQLDGNFVIYNSLGRAIWHSNTRSALKTRLVMQNDHNLVLYDANNRPIWATNTINKNSR